ncbi:MAG: hypothetical protein AAFQ82_22085, partial [Myxococcota bacterium]
MNRRELIRSATGLGACASLGISPRVALGDDGLPTFLIVLGASGGASAIDGAMAIRAEESSNAASLNCFPNESVKTIGPFRAVELERSSLGSIPYAFQTSQSAFVQKHAANMLMATVEGTS